MKRAIGWLLLAVVVFAAAPARAAETVAATKGKAPGSAISKSITTITGIAISPLLGTGAYGAYQYFTTASEDRASLPWYAQVSFWLPAMLLVGACAAKDSLGAILPPGWKKPLDVLETIENKATGLVAAGAVVPFTIDAMSKMILGANASGDPSLVPTGLAMLHFGAMDFTWLLNLLSLPFGIFMFAVVWMASHAINVLILLSPWGAIDAALKGARTAVLGLLTLTATINPLVSAGLSIVIIILSYFVAGWSFRLMTFGTVFSWDFFTLRRKRFTPAPNANVMFSTGGIAKLPGRTYGRLVKAEDGSLSFVYKPWLVLSEKSVPVGSAPADLVVGEGLFFSMIDGETKTCFLLPPRYRGHEEAVRAAYDFKAVQPAGLRKAWSWIAETIGWASKPQVAAV